MMMLRLMMFCESSVCAAAAAAVAAAVAATLCKCQKYSQVWNGYK